MWRDNSQDKKCCILKQRNQIEDHCSTASMSISSLFRLSVFLYIVTCVASVHGSSAFMDESFILNSFTSWSDSATCSGLSSTVGGVSGKCETLLGTSYRIECLDDGSMRYELFSDANCVELRTQPAVFMADGQCRSFVMYGLALSAKVVCSKESSLSLLSILLVVGGCLIVAISVIACIYRKKKKHSPIHYQHVVRRP